MAALLHLVMKWLEHSPTKMGPPGETAVCKVCNPQWLNYSAQPGNQNSFSAIGNGVGYPKGEHVAWRHSPVHWWSMPPPKELDSNIHGLLLLTKRTDAWTY